MFLSTDNPPHDHHPLPSSSFLNLTTSSHELAQSHLQNFSIRDYAYSNRKNNVKNNWPFSPKSLQLLSTHGVTDPLPPFQKSSIVSNQFETTASSSSRKQSVSHVQRGKDLAKLGQNQTIVETRKGLCSQSRIVENGLFTSTSLSKSKEEIVVAATSNNSKNKHSKTCGREGGMVKSKEASCVGIESVMASKTCPICKTFSSASNTTLNAHIDQCISVDSGVPPVMSKPNKPRVNKCLSVDSAVPLVCSKPAKPRGKPRMKVKTMVDIYASAKRCTLEDLDKRNGTKWAVISSYSNRVVADKSEVSKKRKVPPVGVGPVYIDAKGQKLRILTEFSEKKTSTSTTTLLRELREEGSNEKKISSQGCKENSKSSRKTLQGKKHHKYLKLSSHKTNESEIPKCQGVFSGEGSSTGHRRIYNQRMLAKCGPVSKNLNEKGHTLYALRDQPSEDDDDSWSGGDHVVRGTDLSATGSSPLNKQKLRREVSRRNKTMFGSKRTQRVPISEEETSLAGTHLKTVRLKNSLTSIQKDKYSLGKNVREVTDASPRASSMRKMLPPFVANGWRRLSLPVELERARLDLSEEEEEENGKWESGMTLSDDDYVSDDNEERNEVLRRSNPLTFSGYKDYEDDNEEESSEEEEDNNEVANVLDKTDAEFYQSDTPPSNEIIPSERAMYYSEEVQNNMVYEEDDVRFDSEVGKGSLYVEVDTIPIPGPPGSFIPSPRGMSFDEHLGNSSIITSQLQSSMDQLDRNSSESPVSAFSNFAAGRLSFPAELFSPSTYTTTPMSFSVPSHHVTIAEAEQMTIDKTTTPSSFGNNGQESCCCQRKERISEGVTLNHQPSHLLQRRATASSSIAMNLTKSPTRVDPNHPFEQSPCMIQQEFSKFSNKANVNGAVVPPSPSNSVFRLMGKDLMVTNQGEANNEEASRASLKPTPQFLDPLPCAGAALYLNTDLYLRNSLEPTHQPQTQASAFTDNFDHVRYFSPS